MDDTSRGSQVEFPGGGLGQHPGGTVVIMYCPGVILLVSRGYICNYMLSGVISILGHVRLKCPGVVWMKVGHVQGDISACPGVKSTQSTHP